MIRAVTPSLARGIGVFVLAIRSLIRNAALLLGARCSLATDGEPRRSTPGLRFFVSVCAAAAIGALTPSSPAQPASLSLASRAYARIPASPDFALQQFTLSVWLKPTGPGENGGGTLVSKSGRPDIGVFLCSWWMGWSSQTHQVIGLVVHDYGVSAKSVTSNATVALGQEAHAALTFDGVTLRLYINGVLDKEEAYGFSGVYYSTEDVMIGAFNSNTGYTFNRFDGLLDDISIWNRALSAGEVASLAACEPVGSGNGIVAHLPFTDQQLTDTSGHAHSAAPVGTIAFGPQIGALGTGPVFTAQPSGQTACPAVSAGFTVTASGASEFQWQIQTGVGTTADLTTGPLALPCGGSVQATNPTSAQTAIAVSPCPGESTYTVRCVATSPCGSSASSFADIVILPDLNSDGVINTADLVTMLVHFGQAGTSFLQGNIAGADGTVNTGDLVALLVRFGQLCP